MARWHLDPRRLRRSIARRFPGVRWIETLELARRLSPPSPNSAPAPLLLDARTREEHALGHLAGARWLDPQATDLSALPGARSTPIVVYCSVGYRSAALSARLQQSGYTDVRNLCGGIFQWANERRPLHAGDERVDRVHPFSRFWALWLRSDARTPIGST
jgi:rhodanese-related sulfurtransferase